jgi:lantibiotic transport system ATP-binding protein
LGSSFLSRPLVRGAAKVKIAEFQLEAEFMQSIIEIKNLEKCFGKINAVQNVTMNVQQGQIYGFLGPNGAGKTTTIRMILGLIYPSQGQIKVFNKDFSSSTLKRIGSLVETPSAYNHLTGFENLEIMRLLRNAPKHRIPMVLEMVGLADAANRVIREYSLGMKGRLSLASALLHEPELLILDEPTNGLDPQGIREIRDLIRTFPALGITVLVSSHLLAEIDQIATHVGIISNGKMRFEGTLESLRAKHQPSLQIGVSEALKAQGILEQHGLSATLHEDGLQLGDVNLAAFANRILIENGLEVHALQPINNSLEDIFLEITKEGK